MIQKRGEKKGCNPPASAMLKALRARLAEAQAKRAGPSPPEGWCLNNMSILAGSGNGQGIAAAHPLMAYVWRTEAARVGKNLASQGQSPSRS
ncbi:MAG: hypothetical protein Q8L37_05380 [Candidatus Gottesmanbacteria bacterium]|nr:hypothetical protein [Candidatus Gottesmanbacteria bacterium]